MVDLLTDKTEKDEVVWTGVDIICTVEGCGKPAVVRVLPVTFLRVMLCDEHFEKISGPLPEDPEE